MSHVSFFFFFLSRQQTDGEEEEEGGSEDDDLKEELAKTAEQLKDAREKVNKKKRHKKMNSLLSV